MRDRLGRLLELAELVGAVVLLVLALGGFVATVVLIAAAIARGIPEPS